MDIAQKIQALQDALNAAKLDALIQSTHDRFMSEYTPDAAKRLSFMSGFDGSAGTLVVLAEPADGKPAALFTDGRYTLQASQQLDASLFHVIDSAEHSPVAWLQRHQPSAVLGYDAWLHPHSQVARWEGFSVKPLSENLIDAIWSDRPTEPAAPAFAHPLNYAGESTQSKISRVIAAMDEAADAVFLGLPDGINWLLNIRGDDIPFNPLVLCYALLTRSGELTLISHPRDWPAFEGDVKHLALNDFIADPAALFAPYASVQMDASSCVCAIWRAALDVVPKPDPTLVLKAIKNETEIAGMREAHKRDGRALSAFLGWLETQEGWDELSAAAKLEQLRAQESGELYRGPSFDTISGTGPNGAIVHYRVTSETNRAIQDGELYLVDSGGQYPDGTTDVTRTVIKGAPSEEMIDRYTRVLKGHIAIDRAVFPEGTSGSQLDALARQYLWEVGEDYAHGTGHGVGSYLCVHEGPQRISKRAGDVPLAAGMVLSNEPGYYKNGAYGIRIENLVLVVAAKQPGFLAFETLTLAPLDERLIKLTMLSDDERAWLEVYHRRVEANL